MFKRTPKQPSLLDVTIEHALSNLDLSDPNYLKKVEAVETLYKLKTIDGQQRVSADTKAIVLGNLAGILIIVSHERAHVVATKAFGLLKKL